MENIKMYTDSNFILCVISKGNMKSYSKAEGWTPKAAFRDFYRAERIARNPANYFRLSFVEV